MVATGQHGAAFERRPRLPVHAEFAADRDLGRARGGVDVAALEHPLAVEVVAPAFVHRVAAAAHVARCVDDRVEHLEIDGDGGGEVLGFGPRRRNAGGDRLADIPRLVGGERRPRRRLRPRRLGFDADRLDARQVGRGENPAGRVGRLQDRPDARVGVRAAHKRHLHFAGQFDVRHKFAAAIEVPLVLTAQQRGAHSTGIIRHLAAPSRASPRHRRSRRRCWCSRCSGRCCRRALGGSRPPSRPGRGGSGRAP